MLHFTKATVKNEIFSQFENLYLTAFPKIERRTMQSIKDLLENDPDYTLFLIEDKSVFVGFISMFTFEDFIFYEHFAISDKIRSKGYGKRVMIHLIEEIKLPIVLEVELPVTGIAKRRVNFYKRIGFRLWEQDYEQPAYHPNYKSIPLKLMTYGKINLNVSFQKIKNAIYTKVYRLSE